MLQQLIMTDWQEPPSRAGLTAVLQQLHVSEVDISRCSTTGSQSLEQERQAGAALSLTSLLAGTTPRQQDQQQQQQQGRDAALTSCSRQLALGLALSSSSLRRLTCMHMHVQIGADTWAALTGLEYVDVSCCPGMRGHGLTQLTRLHTLVARGEEGSTGHNNCLALI